MVSPAGQCSQPTRRAVSSGGGRHLRRAAYLWILYGFCVAFVGGVPAVWFDSEVAQYAVATAAAGAMAFGVSKLAEEKGHHGGIYFIISLFFSVLIGWIVVSLLRDKNRMVQKASADHTSFAVKHDEGSQSVPTIRSRPKRTPRGKRHIMAALGVGVCGLMAVFPPWVGRYAPARVGSSENLGYGFVMTPPARPKRGGPWDVSIDLRRLFIQWSAVAAITAVLILTFRERGDRHSHP